MRSLPLAVTVVALVVAAGAACTNGDSQAQGRSRSAMDGFRVNVSPVRGGGRCAPGEHRLELGDGRVAFLRVNPGKTPGARPLLVALHGAASGLRGGLYAFRGAWKTPGLVIVAPAARGSTWSALYGADVDLETVERATRRAFARCRIDPRRVGIGGFSDGATYALTLGLANGRLFRFVIGLSPGGVLTDDFTGKPRVFIAHGTRDDVLPKSRTSDILVRDLRGAGYRVTYVAFRGGHQVLDWVSRRAARWLVG